MFLFPLVALACSCLCRANAQDAPRVTTASGKIKGHYLTSVSGKSYKAFEGVPFAEKPLDSLRFQPPVSVTPWSDELAADQFKGICMGLVRAPTTGQFVVNGVEDCLYVNLYVPEGEFDKPLPVLFWIYGGGYQMAVLSGREQNHFVDENVIFVTFGYRLSVLGFLSTEDEVVPGNMGLKDQALALAWTRTNIRAFGGDPEQITLVGLSAGGASVHHFYLSSLTAGMFRAGISISGTALSYWALKKNPRANAVKVAESLGCPTQNSSEMVACFRKQSAETLLRAAEQLYPWILYSSVPFGPVIEKAGDKPFLDKDPLDIINSGNFSGVNVPWITGLVSDEGLLSIAGFITNDTALRDLNTKWNTVGPDLLYYDFGKAKDDRVSEQMLSRYLGGKPIDNSTAKSFVNMLNDGIHKIHAERAVRAMARSNESATWFYYNSYRAANGLSIIVINRATNSTNFTLDYGPSHADDASLAFLSFSTGPTLTAQDLKMHDELVRFWTSVTKAGSPKAFEAAWKPVNAGKEELDYLHMAAPENFTPKTFKNFGDKAFWKSIKFIE